MHTLSHLDTLVLFAFILHTIPFSFHHSKIVRSLGCGLSEIDRERAEA